MSFQVPSSSSVHPLVELFRTMQFDQGREDRVTINVYGTPEKPLFVAQEIVAVFKIPRKTWQDQIRKFPGQPFLSR